MSKPKNPAAQSLGAIGGKSKSPAKMAAMKVNLAKARESKAKKSKKAKP